MSTKTQAHTPGPYTVQTDEDGPLGPTNIVTGPGGYRSRHGGGKDGGKFVAKLEAAQLNAAYRHGFEDVGKSHADLLAAAAAALCKLAGENIMGGCAACGNEHAGKHHRSCIVMKLRAAIAKAKDYAS